MIYHIRNLTARHKIGNHYTWAIVLSHPATTDIFASNNCEIYETSGKLKNQKLIKGNIQDIIASYNTVIAELNQARLGKTGPSFTPVYDQ